LTLQNDGKRSEVGRELDKHRSSARSLYQEKRFEEAAREYQQCVDLDPEDFEAALGIGYCFGHLRRYEEAVAAFEKARLLRPESYDANFWLGLSLTRLGRFNEAVAPLERAHAARNDDEVARRHLFICYLVTGRGHNAFDIYPELIAYVATALLLVYILWLAALLPFSLPLRSKMFPGLRFSVSWVALVLAGQFAFPLLLAALPWPHLNENILTGTILAGLPVIVVAATGFTRQPWGAPFRWPLRFGPVKALLISILAVLLIQAMSIASSHFYTQLTHKPAPLQNTVPFIQAAFSANPAVAWLAVGFFIPVIEEILFRGLVFGAFEKRWGMKGAIFGSGFLFACIHFQLVGFLYLFCFGLVLGWARRQSGSLGLPILLHSLNNMAALAFTMASPAGS
jgi:membrane protease YdiL (CAAX protease family)